MASTSMEQHIHTLLLEVFRPSLDLAPEVGCLASNVSFVLKSRNPNIISPEDISILCFTDIDANTEPKIQYIAVVRHHRLESFMQVELRASVPADDLAMLLPVFQGNVLHEMKLILPPLKKAMEGEKFEYYTFNDLSKNRKDAMDTLIAELSGGLSNNLNNSNDVAFDTMGFFNGSGKTVFGEDGNGERNEHHMGDLDHNLQGQGNV